MSAPSGPSHESAIRPSPSHESKLLVDGKGSASLHGVRPPGYEAVHWSDVGERNAPDREILEHVHRNGQVILTQDLDFGTLLAVGAWRHRA
ncbi:MAG: DUF5615 family PIN-like protein [Candidatus Nanopelagicales bacterium]